MQNKAIFIIKGMTCEGCEAHVNNELSKVVGVWTYKNLTGYELILQSGWSYLKFFL
ncbi:cation transporter [Daejeonella sp.]|uniref:cation transporter n=1 Tax=Daejeonella sp. TaxID=2805397 RepID=UPI003C767DDC